jgi:hypothetical protein
MRTTAVEEHRERLEEVALRFALVKRADATPAAVEAAMDDLERAALELLNLHEREAPPCRTSTSATSPAG